tara:strand:+ start:1402 stop:2406 length:1005 start_codon:yes stop_codon:yes gene_type:complete
LEKLSIIVPCRNEIDYIKNLLDSINKQDYPNEFIELIVVDGMSNDGTNEYLKTLDIKNLVVLENSAQYVSNAMNIGIKNATGNIIVRMDVHSIFPENYLSILVAHINSFPKVGNVGVPCKTLPANNSFQSMAISMALSSSLGVGNSLFRTKIPTNFELVDTVPFGCWKKEIFDIVGLFDEDLIRNQDDEFNQRILNAGMEIHLLPGPQVQYFGRQDFKSHAKMFYQYGLFKPLVNKKIGKITTLRQLAPLGLVLYIFIMLMMAAFSFFISILMFTIFVSGYLTASISYFVKNKKNFYLLIYFILAILITHISYGTGYFRGLFFNIKSKNITDSR